jgi:CubicO group peptidase (beta-lactamase class C family)
MDEQEILNRMENSLARGIEQGIFPGAVASLMRKGGPVVTAIQGNAGTGSYAVPVNEYTQYDMASLTKVMVTLPLVLLSVQQGKLSLTDDVALYLPELGEGADREGKLAIKVVHLLTHTSGLPAWRPFFLMGKGKKEYLRLIAGERMIGTPGKQVVYSDPGFMLLGFLLERIWDEDLDALAKRMIFQPSGMIHTCYLLQKEPYLQVGAIAPTENGNLFEQNMAQQYLSELEPADHPKVTGQASFEWRQGIICGTVHDCNAHYGLDGVSGHAGLFSTLTDVERYMEIWTSDEAPVRIDPLLRAMSTRSLTNPHLQRRGLGWIVSAAGGALDQIAAGCSGGDLLSDRAFGHTGFTGTSIWSDPVRGATLITLTNRVHPTASPHIGSWRIAHHNHIFSGIKPVSVS